MNRGHNKFQHLPLEHVRDCTKQAPGSIDYLIFCVLYGTNSKRGRVGYTTIGRCILPPLLCRLDTHWRYTKKITSSTKVNKAVADKEADRKKDEASQETTTTGNDAGERKYAVSEETAWAKGPLLT